MILTGIADEAGMDIQTQVKAHKELEWDHIELRLVGGKNVAGELPQREFEQMCEVLEEEKMQVTAFASRIGNWSRHINDDFKLDIDDLKASIPRMERLKTKNIRIMSWRGDGVDLGEWFKEARRRLKELARIAADGGIYLCHENCEGWGGLSAGNMLELKSAVDQPHFLLLYDLGNTVSHGLEPWSFFKTIRRHFDYLHIKDAKMNLQGGPSQEYTYCGEGDARLKEILSMIIIEDGYDGVLSIEPHVASVVHLEGGSATPGRMYASYIKYGMQFKKIIHELKTNEKKQK